MFIFRNGVKDKKACNRILCECKHCFCYICGAKCGKDGVDNVYAHFGGVSQKGPHTCNLYDKAGDEEKRIENAARNADKRWRTKHPNIECNKFNIDKFINDWRKNKKQNIV
jgi:hypothetical protein